MPPAVLPTTGYASDQPRPTAPAVPNELAEVQTDLDTATIAEAIDALSGKQAELSTFFSYYAGTASVPLVSERLHEIYRNLTFTIAENWSAVVVGLHHGSDRAHWRDRAGRHHHRHDQSDPRRG